MFDPRRTSGAIETLRDSNARQFECDRPQYLALRATTPKEAHDAAAGGAAEGAVSQTATGRPSEAAR
jgi:hypothetical protein